MGETPADTSAISTAISEPLTSTTDGQTATGRTIADLVLGIQFTAAAAAAVQPHRGLRFTRLRLPGQMTGRVPIQLDRPGGSFQ